MALPRLTELIELSLGLPGLTGALGTVMAEAASICLEEQGHDAVVALLVQGAFEDEQRFLRLPITDQMRRSYRDTEEATELGACAIAILVLTELTGLTVVERSVRGGGFDYWLGQPVPAGAVSPMLPFQNLTRLEVSGIRSGGAGEVRSRVTQKLRQTVPSDGSVPEYIVVVEFGRPLAHVEQK